MIQRRGTGPSQLVRRHRRSLAALAAAGSILMLGLALRPAEIATRPVLVAARDLPTGTRLTEADLATARVPATLANPGALTEAPEAIGRVVAAPLVGGEPVSLARLFTPPAAAWAVAPGTTPMPVRFADAGAAALLAPGQRIDVLAAAASALDGSLGAPTAHVVAREALVLAVVDGGSADGWAGVGTGAGDGSPGGSAPLVVLGVDPTQALELAGAAAGEMLSFALRPS